MIGEIEVVADEAQLARRSAGLFVECAREAIAARGMFTVSLAGGSTPKAAFDLLAAQPLRGQVEWASVRFYFGDERCVPPGDPESNYGMAERHLFAPLGIPPENVYRIHGEDAPEAAAAAYEGVLRETLGE